MLSVAVSMEEEEALKRSSSENGSRNPLSFPSACAAKPRLLFNLSHFTFGCDNIKRANT
jgi:hypothetical protein